MMGGKLMKEPTFVRSALQLTFIRNYLSSRPPGMIFYTATHANYFVNF
jgi:hypothetical protein